MIGFAFIVGAIAWVLLVIGLAVDEAQREANDPEAQARRRLNARLNQQRDA